MQFNCNLKLYIFLEMFFDTNQINDTLLCSKCEGKVDIPKCLPCGEAICSLCETSIQVLENNKYRYIYIYYKNINKIICMAQKEIKIQELFDYKIGKLNSLNLDRKLLSS